MPEENNHDKIIGALADMNEAIGNHFDQVGQRLTEHDARFDQIDQRLRGHDTRFDRVDQQLTHILERLNRIEDMILQEHARRLEELERKVGLTQ